MHILFPALAMMLGWGLRGYIGGGPYGAMIPGAMVALSISILLGLSTRATSVLLVFAVFGIGIGGEMTYGQTLGVLRNPETLWWGAAGTTIKGAMWGLLGGAVMAMGFIFKKTSKKTIIISLLLIILGMFVGFNLINDPMLIYFSDPAKPRAESWAGLLFAVIFLLVYLKIKTPSSDFKLILRFALIGMVGGALGFGLGSFWLVLGTYLPDLVFHSWWKAMELSFGFILGASLGYAAWLCRNEPLVQNLKVQEAAPTDNGTEWTALLSVFAVGLLVHWLIPETMVWLTKTETIANMPGGNFKEELARLAENYTFTGLLFVLILIKFPKAAWQIGITLTFCHAAIDLVRDFYPDVNVWSPFNLRFVFVLLMTAAVAILTHYFSHRENKSVNLFLLLIWSCLIISFLRLSINPSTAVYRDMSFCQIVCGKHFVDISFTVLSIILTWTLMTKTTIKPSQSTN